MSREQDRELLEAAARACGIEKWIWQDWPGMDVRYGITCSLYSESHDHWNPLQSDADAFRLMVDCGIEVVPAARQVTAIAPSKNGLIVASQEDYADKHAATRRAIVRAAAAMSEGQEG